MPFYTFLEEACPTKIDKAEKINGTNLFQPLKFGGPSPKKGGTWSLVPPHSELSNLEDLGVSQPMACVSFALASRSLRACGPPGRPSASSNVRRRTSCPTSRRKPLSRLPRAQSVQEVQAQSPKRTQSECKFESRKASICCRIVVVFPCWFLERIYHYWIYDYFVLFYPGGLSKWKKVLLRP